MTTNPMRENAEARAAQAAADEILFHETGQHNALGGYIGCNGPRCWDLIQRIESENSGNKIQVVW